MIKSKVQASETLSLKSISRSAYIALVVFAAIIDFFVPCLYSMIGGFGLWWDGILIPTWFITHLAAIASVAGLVGKSWLAGLFAGVLGFVLFAGLSLMGMSIGSSGSSFFIFGITLDQEPFSALCIAFVVPWIVIVCSLPLYLTRFLLGWRFSFGLATAKREPLVVVDFFLLMTLDSRSAFFLGKYACSVSTCHHLYILYAVELCVYSSTERFRVFDFYIGTYLAAANRLCIATVRTKECNREIACPLEGC